jgi:hypothetical protein
MTVFVPVQVPEHLVLDVYRFIADRDGTPAINASSKNDEAREWTLEELTLLAESDATSVQLMAKVLTILLEAAPASLSIDEVGAKVEMEGLTVQKTFGAASRWMKNRFGGDIRWPINWSGETHWYINEHNAAIWKQIIG